MDTVSPTLPRGSTYAFGIGGAFDITKSREVNAAAYYAPFDDITTTGEAFPATYKATAKLFSLGLTYRM